MSAPQPAPRTQSQSRGGDPVPPASARRPAEPHPLDALHEAFGNLGVVRRLADPAVQARFEVGAPDDEYEREADAVAASIVGGPPSREPPAIRRRAEDDDKNKPAAPQRAAGAAAKAPAPAPAPAAKAAPVPAVTPAPLATPKPPAPGAAPAAVTAPPKAAPAPAPAPAPKAPEPPKPAPAPKPPAAVPMLNADKARTTAPPPPPHAGGTTTMHPEKKHDEPAVAAKAEPGAVPSVTSQAARTIQSQEGAGQPLSPRDRGFFESRLGHDLGGVRIHDDAAARTAARDVQAQAFTYGQDIYFGPGRYQPGTAGGRELLAHELAHTIQQRPGAPLARRIQRQTGGGSTSGGGGGGAAGPSPPGSATTDKHEYAGLTVAQNAPQIDLGNPPPPLKGNVTGAGGTRRLSLDQVGIPGFKLQSAPGKQWDKALGPFTKRAGFARPPDIQVTTWRNQVGLVAPGGAPPDRFTAKFGDLINAHHHGERVPVVPTAVYRLRRRGGAAGETFTGTPQALARELSIPAWTSSGANAAEPYQVDHIRELQLADYPFDSPGNHWTDLPTNLWLLHGTTNTDAGRHIQGSISTRITTFRGGIREYYRLREVAGGNRKNPVAAADAAMRADLTALGHAELLDTREANANYTVDFDRVVADHDGPATVGAALFWTPQQIRDGDHLSALEPTAPTAHPYITIFANAASATPAAAGGGGGPGAPVTLGVAGFDFDATTVQPRTSERRFLPPLAVVEKHLTETPTGGTYGYLVMDFIRNRNLEFPPGANRRLDIQAVGGVDRAGVIDSSQAIALLTGARYKELSPIEILSAGIEPGRGFGVHGRIRADVPLLREGIDFEVAGDEISVYKEFGAGALSVPPPFHVTDATLRLSAGTQSGLQVGGDVFFAIDRVGSGHIGAVAGRQGFQLAGDFDFATDFFQPASIGITFAHDSATGENHWGAHGDIGIPAGKVRGIRSALLHVSYADERLDATGHATFDIPGVRDADVHLTYDPQTGLVIAGAATLGQLPGIRGGSLDVTLSERPGGGGYKVAAHGTAQPAIPGVDVAELAIAYDDGGFFAHASMSISRGLIEGSVDVGATNRPVDELGRPQMDGEPLPQVAIFGSGSATVQITPWLKGTAGIRLLPNGEIAVSGRLTIPAFNLWNPITPDPVHLIHPPPIHFPIFGPVVLEIGGGLDAVYGLGAGVLSGDLGLDYNPSHEDQTHLYGDLSLHASAFAGLELDLFAGVGLDALVASVTGRITLGAQVRGEVDADAGVHIDWTPGAGISFDGHVSGSIAPKLIFHLDASIVVSALFWDHTWTKELGRREFGSSLEMSVMLPFHWQEGQAFAIDWNRLEFHHPDLDPLQTAKDFIEEVV